MRSSITAQGLAAQSVIGRWENIVLCISGFVYSIIIIIIVIIVIIVIIIIISFVVSLNFLYLNP